MTSSGELCRFNLLTVAFFVIGISISYFSNSEEKFSLKQKISNCISPLRYFWRTLNPHNPHNFSRLFSSSLKISHYNYTAQRTAPHHCSLKLGDQLTSLILFSSSISLQEKTTTFLTHSNRVLQCPPIGIQAPKPMADLSFRGNRLERERDTLNPQRLSRMSPVVLNHLSGAYFAGWQMWLVIDTLNGTFLLSALCEQHKTTVR